MIKGRIEQTKHNILNNIYKLTIKEEIILTAKKELNKINIYNNNGNEIYSIKFSFENVIEYKTVHGEIYKNDLLIGNIIYRIEYFKMFKRFYSYNLEIDNRNFKMLSIGLGKKGLKLPIFENNFNNQIALSEKDVITNDYKDTYNIYTKDEHELQYLFILIVFYDSLMQSNEGEYAKNNKKKMYYYTINKKLKSYYDPDWKKKNGILE